MAAKKHILYRNDLQTGIAMQLAVKTEQLIKREADTMDFMTYKKYIGSVQYNKKEKIFYGSVQGICEDIIFEGVSKKQLENNFHKVVDEYVNLCKKIGGNSRKKSHRSVNIKISPEMYYKMYVTAVQKKISINQFIKKSIFDALGDSEIHNKSCI